MFQSTTNIYWLYILYSRFKLDSKLPSKPNEINDFNQSRKPNAPKPLDVFTSIFHCIADGKTNWTTRELTVEANEFSSIGLNRTEPINNNGTIREGKYMELFWIPIQIQQYFRFPAKMVRRLSCEPRRFSSSDSSSFYGSVLLCCSSIDGGKFVCSSHISRNSNSSTGHPVLSLTSNHSRPSTIGLHSHACRWEFRCKFRPATSDQWPAVDLVCTLLEVSLFLIFIVIIDFKIHTHFTCSVW